MKFLLATLISFGFFAARANEKADLWPTPGFLNGLPAYSLAEKSERSPRYYMNAFQDTLEVMWNIDLLNLLPQDFAMVQGTKAQPIIDNLTVNVFKSVTARKALCFLTMGSEDDLRLFLDVSHAAAVQLKRQCADQPVTAEKLIDVRETSALFHYMEYPPPKWNLYALGITPHVVRPVHPKKYFFAIPLTTAAKISAYTASGNGTLFIVPKEGASTPELVRLMAHELAITFDQFAEMVPFDAIPNQDAWEGVNLARLYGGNYRRSAFSTPQDLKTLRCALHDPSLRYAATIERASRFEDAIIHDLGLSSVSPAVASGKGCQGDLLHWSLLQVTFSDATIDNLTGMNIFCGDDGHSPHRFEIFWNRLQLIQKTLLQTRSTGKTVPLCELWLTPHVGAGLPDDSVGGPRPRIGGWNYSTPDLGSWSPDDLETAVIRSPLDKLDSETLERLNLSLQEKTTMDTRDGKIDLDYIWKAGRDLVPTQSKSNPSAAETP